MYITHAAVLLSRTQKNTRVDRGVSRDVFSLQEASSHINAVVTDVQYVWRTYAEKLLLPLCLCITLRDNEPSRTSLLHFKAPVYWISVSPTSRHTAQRPVLLELLCLTRR